MLLTKPHHFTNFHFNVRLGGGVAERVVAAGLRCIVSNQGKWYLDHLDSTWQDFYMYEPLTNITSPAKQKLVIGGEVCMWGEHIDASDIEQTIWPRAAAAAGTLSHSSDESTTLKTKNIYPVFVMYFVKQ